MIPHHAAKQIKDANIYYLVGLLAGLFIGVTLEGSPLWIPILGIVGLLFTAFFVNIFVKGRADA
jgi:hypothetical protein